MSLVKIQEGLGLGLVSDLKPNVSVLSMSRIEKSCLHLYFSTNNCLVFSKFCYKMYNNINLYSEFSKNTLNEANSFN